MRQQNDLIEKALNGNQDAKDKLFENNTGLIWSIVRKFLGRGVESEDLFQIGSIGLIKAINKFDVSYNVEFSTYAVPMILGEIKRFLRDDGVIKVSRSLKELAQKAFKIKEKLTNENGEEPTVKEIATILEVSAEDLSVALDATRRPESLYSVFESEKGETRSLIEKIENPDKFEIRVVDKIMLEEIIKSYSERDREIINLRYFKEKTQTEVARQLGISQVQVSRIEKKILSDMKNKI